MSVITSTHEDSYLRFRPAADNRPQFANPLPLATFYCDFLPLKAVKGRQLNKISVYLPFKLARYPNGSTRAKKKPLPFEIDSGKGSTAFLPTVADKLKIVFSCLPTINFNDCIEHKKPATVFLFCKLFFLPVANHCNSTKSTSRFLLHKNANREILYSLAVN